MFSQYCDDKFSVEPVKVIGSDGKATLYPQLAPRKVRKGEQNML